MQLDSLYYTLGDVIFFNLIKYFKKLAVEELNFNPYFCITKTIKDGQIVLFNKYTYCKHIDLIEDSLKLYINLEEYSFLCFFHKNKMLGMVSQKMIIIIRH